MIYVSARAEAAANYRRVSSSAAARQPRRPARPAQFLARSPPTALHDMPRNHNPGTLRNRNRITNKTRLKVIHGNIDADPLVLEEDEEKARVVSTAGVDAEDANVSPFSSSHAPSTLLVVKRPVARADWLESVGINSAVC